MKTTRVSIIGLGQVGTAFLKVFSGYNFEITSVFNRTEISTSLTSTFPGVFFKKGMPSKKDELGDLIFITVSDDAISKVSKRLAEIIGDPKSKNIVHCSGTHTSESLSDLKNRGAKVASFHPIKAITKSSKSFENIWFDIEGDDDLLQILEELAELFGAYSFRVEPEAKSFFHASAVVASNYLVVLADLVSKISAQGNIPEETAIKALAPLMENTLSNITELGVTDALTGPIARGDVQTIENHLSSLESKPKLQMLYKTLGMEAACIAERKKEASPSLPKIKELLS